MEPNERGWYDDPKGAMGELRYWDGFRWYDQTIKKSGVPVGPNRTYFAMLRAGQSLCKPFVALSTIAGLVLIAYTIGTELLHFGSFTWSSWIFYAELCFLLSHAIAQPIRYLFLSACAKGTCSVACKGVCAANIEAAAGFPEKSGELERINKGACSRANYLVRYYQRKYKGMSLGSLLGAFVGSIPFLFMSGPWTGTAVVVVTFFVSLVSAMVIGGRVANRNKKEAPELAAIVSAAVSDLHPEGDKGEIALQEEVAWRFVPFGSCVD